jgi:hypothetical protein
VTDESNIAWWFWLILIVGVNATWITMDIWLKRHGHEYLTTEIREILAGGGWSGIIFAAAVGATFGIAYYHFFWQR